MKALIPAILWSLVIFYLSAGDGINLPESWIDIISWDKLGHLTVYAIQTYLLIKGFLGLANLKSERKIFFLAVSLSILFGISMEIMQYLYFPNRYFEFLDIIANIIGSLTGLFIFQKTTYK